MRKKAFQEIMVGARAPTQFETMRLMAALFVA